MTGGRATTQTGRQQTTGMPLEDQERVIHVLVVSSIEKTQLLLSVGGIVGGIDIEQDFAALANLLSAEAYEGIEPAIVSADELAGRGRVFPATEGGLGNSGADPGADRRAVGRPDHAVDDRHHWHPRSRPRSGTPAAAPATNWSAEPGRPAWDRGGTELVPA